MRRHPARALGRAALVCVFLASGARITRAQGFAEAHYKKHCDICHGADGKGDTAMGKKTGARDFGSPQVQKETDAELLNIIMNGKNKMPAYKNMLRTEEAKEHVALVRKLAKQK